MVGFSVVAQNMRDYENFMSILKIAKMGHPVLARVAEPVSDPQSPEIARIVEDMIETMVDANGAGLAAPQVHISQRIVVFHAPGDADGALTALINPEITPLSDEKEEGWEGCLSVPGLRGLVPRYSRIRYRGTTPNGDEIDREVSGFHARVVQHECDHLDGVLYPQRMTNLADLIFESEFRFRMGPGNEMMSD